MLTSAGAGFEVALRPHGTARTAWKDQWRAVDSSAGLRVDWMRHRPYSLSASFPVPSFSLFLLPSFLPSPPPFLFAWRVCTLCLPLFLARASSSLNGFECVQ